MPVPAYLLAMKCMAARVGTPDATDVQDVKFLLQRLGLQQPAEVLDIVARYYPAQQIQPKTQFSPRLSWRNCTVTTLKQVAEQVRAGRPFEIELGDFLDAFYRQPTVEAVRESPAVLAGLHPRGDIVDAFLAAAAEHLCLRFELPIPGWVFEPCRYLERPFFALDAASFRATLLLESPAEFRSRNLFVTANALSRASELVVTQSVVGP